MEEQILELLKSPDEANQMLAFELMESLQIPCDDFFNGLLYLGKPQLQPLQLFLRRILLMASTEVMQAMGSSAAGAGAAAQTTMQIRYVCIVFATVPIIMICPFIQKYLVKGTMLGAVKG